MLNVGLLGLGRHGVRYAEHLSAGQVPGARLARIWRRDPSRRADDARRFAVPAAESPRALAEADDVDVVVLAVPAALHLELGGLVADAGKPLLIEKPLALDGKTARELARRFQASELALMVAQTLRFDPLVIALGEAAPAIGRLVGFSFEQRIEPRGLAWEDEPSSAGRGVLVQSAVHTLDALRLVTAASGLRVRAAELARLHTTHVEDHAALIVELTGGPNEGAIGTVAASKIGGSRHVRFALYGAEGGLEADLIGRTLLHRRRGGAETRAIPDDPTVRAVLRAFVRHVTDPAATENPVPASSTFPVFDAIDAAYALAERGER